MAPHLHPTDSVVKPATPTKHALAAMSRRVRQAMAAVGVGGFATLGAAAFAAAGLSGSAWAQEASRVHVEKADNAQPLGHYVRSKTNPKTAATTLQVAARRFEKAGGPDIWLIGAVHIGDAAYYDAVQVLMNQMGLLLYEGVGRPDMFGHWPEPGDDASQADFTGMQLLALADVLERSPTKQGAFHASLDALADTWQDKKHSLLANHLAHARTDAWGHAIAYKLEDDGQAVTLTSFGRDGKTGGQGADQDVSVTVDRPDWWQRLADGETPPGSESGIRDLQTTMAETFGVAYQLHSIDYSQTSYWPSDMSLRQFESAMAKVGVPMSFGGADNPFEQDDSGGDALLREMGGPQAGFAVSVMKGLSHFVRASPHLRQLARLMMIELLSRPDLMDLSAAQMGSEHVVDVLIGQRNQVVLDDLAAVLSLPQDHDSLGVFYGAAHLPDMAERLADQLGYAPTQDVQWFDAMTADPASLGMPPENVAMIKAMLQRSVDQAILQQKMMRPRK